MGLFSSQPPTEKIYAVQCVTRRSTETTYVHWCRVNVFTEPDQHTAGSGLLTVIGPFVSNEECDRFCKSVTHASQLAAAKPEPAVKKKPEEPKEEPEEEDDDDDDGVPLPEPESGD